MKKCVVCNVNLEGTQRKFCSNRCKQVDKNQKRAEQDAAVLKENASLKRKVKRLENKIKKLEAA